MKTTFALAALAASSSASGIDFNGSVQFVAGLMDGLIGKNDLPELQQCMQDDQALVNDINTAIADFEQGSVQSIIAGVQEGMKIAGEFPTALSDCQNISDDINAVEAYFAQFKDVKATAEKIFKNVLSNFRGVESDVTTLETDFDNSQFFQAGEDMAQLFIDTLGPVQQPSNQAVQISIDNAKAFLGGFVSGMVGHNDLPYVKQCMKDEAVVQSEVTTIISDAKSGDITSYIDAAKTALALSKEVPVALADCKEIKEDVASIKQWASQFTDAKTDAKIIVQNAIKNYQEVMTEGAALNQDIKGGNYEAAGNDVAVILTDLLVAQSGIQGDHPKVHTAVEFVTGFIGTLIHMEDLTNLETCIHHEQVLQSDMDVILADFKKHDITSILNAFTVIGQMATELPSDVADCKQVKEGLPILEQWAEIFKHPKAVATRAAKGIFQNYLQIYTDVKDIETQQAAGDFKQVGHDVAEIVVLALGEPSAMEITPFEGATDYLKVVEGLLYGLVKDENLKNIDNCITDAANLEAMVKVAIGDFEQGGLTNYVQAIKEVGLILQAVPSDISDCKNVSQDITAIEAFAKALTPMTILDNAVSNFKGIVTDVSKIESDINSGNMMQAGEDIANIISLVAGPVE